MNSLPNDMSQWTMARALEYWQAQRAADGLSFNTLRFDAERVKAIVARTGKLKLLDVAALGMLARYRIDRLKTVSGRTFNAERLIVRSVLSMAQLWPYCADHFKPARQRRRVVGRALEPEDLERLLMVGATHPRWQVAYYIAILDLNTGLRGCEIRGEPHAPKTGDFVEVKGLRLADIDIAKRVVRIRRASTKTDAGERTVPLNDHGIGAIIWLMARQKRICSELGVEPAASHYLLPACMGRRGGRGYDPSKPQRSFRSAWRSWTDAAGLRGLRFHDLRHHVRSDFADNDVDTKTAMAVLGHDDVKTSHMYEHERLAARARRMTLAREAVDALMARRPPSREDGSQARHAAVAGH